ncbi:hypothetical protein ccbrp13_13630 [Ktedonobacteria bacterium brp13]|nr:hypothetical protein ccbrp13_13630 [Ktedonobacteria bacterium brp13]
MKPNERAQKKHDELLPGHVSTWAVTEPERVETFDHVAFDEVLLRVALTRSSGSTDPKGELPMSAIPSVPLNNGVKMPLLGFGVFQMPTGCATRSQSASKEKE